MPDHGPTYCGSKPDRGRINPGREYPGEGYAILKCGNTEVKIGFTLLHHMILRNNPGSPFFGDVQNLQEAINSITCEASLGRKGE